MSYIWMLSLEHIALVKIAATLWNRINIGYCIENFDSPFRIKKWKNIENKVTENVQNLPLPQRIKKKVMAFIKPVGIQIVKWMEYLYKNNFVVTCQPDNLCWTPQGTIEQKKTAETLVRDEKQDIASRYKLACTNCLVDYIPELWNKMPEYSIKNFYSENHPEHVEQHELVVFWTYDIKGEIDKLNIFHSRWRGCRRYQYAFERAAVGGNKVASEYFLQKLTSEEREVSLVRSTKSLARRLDSDDRSIAELFRPREYSDLLCFLLSQMTEEQQMEVFRGLPLEVLTILLIWPWQSCFMDTVNRMWTFLPVRYYEILLICIVDRQSVDEYNYNYKTIFREFWKQSPDYCKRSILDDIDILITLLSCLFQLKDKKSISLILNRVTFEQTERLMFHFQGMYLCRDLVHSNEWDLLTFFIGKCLSSQEIVIKFKDEFLEYVRRIHIKDHSTVNEIVKRKDKWGKCFQILDDIIREYDKSV